VTALLQPVSKYMTPSLVSIGVDDDAGRAAEIMLARHISSVAVVDQQGAAVGVISRRDLLRAGLLDRTRRGGGRAVPLPRPARELMNRPVIAVGPDDTIRHAAEVMVSHKIHRVLVERDGQTIGVCSTKDVMFAIIDARVAVPISDVMSTPVISVDVAEPLSSAMEALERAHIGGLVVTERDEPVGLFSETEALLSQSLDPATPVEAAMSQALLFLPGHTSLHRAAGFTLATQARRVLTTSQRDVAGVLSGFDFARYAAG